MSRIEKTIVVEAPLEDVYAQWTQFEEFPRFMEGVDRVVQLDDQTLEWTATVASREKHWRARIVDQTPHERIAWRGLDGAQNDGAVLFNRVGQASTEIRLVVDAHPEGVLEEAGDRLGFLDRRVSGDLHRFKAFIEARDGATGSWSGEIHGDEVIPPAVEPEDTESARAQGRAQQPSPPPPEPGQADDRGRPARSLP